MKWVRPFVPYGFAVILGFLTSTTNVHAVDLVPSHKQSRFIAPAIDGRPVKLQTFCVGSDKNLWMCCSGVEANGGSILVYSAEGELKKNIPLTFLPQALNIAPNGSIFVAGMGKVARLSPDGEVEETRDLPGLGNKEELLKKLKKQAEENQKQLAETYKTQLENLRKQLEKLEKAPEDETEKAKERRERRIRILTQSLEQAEANQQVMEQSIQVDDYMLSRMGTCTGLAATSEDIYISCTKSEGYGYDVWRLNHELDDPKVVIQDLGGCCGQLDIQSDGVHLIVAENTKFEVGYYDRDGKRLHGWGKRVRNDEGFGSCCNPMNVRCCDNGDVLTAESSIGHIKRFNPKGELVAFIGTAKVAGGCKHVAIGFDSEKNYHYMMNEDRSHVAVLVPKELAPAETEDEKMAREAMESKGKYLFGTWELKETVKTETQPGFESMGDYITSGFGHLEFAPDGKLIKGPKGLKSGANATTSTSVEPSLLGALFSTITGATVDGGTIAPAAAIMESEWRAMHVKDDKLSVVTVDSEVEAFGMTVEFLDNDEAKFAFFYSDPSQAGTYGTFIFKRVSLEACGKDCSDCAQKAGATEKASTENP
jgi:hypothetical protein